ncbi:MAG: GTPase Era [Candidatus Aminicenantes bacterium]|nr:GTPase Era [Candidatus Aminicenantes bacterium]
MPSRKPKTQDKKVQTAPRTGRPRPAKAKPVPKYRTGYVALIGRPNAGKSTLLNKILGQKIAITSDKPQTTRLSILGIHTTPRGQIIFIDNPGLHKPLHKLNKRMMNFVYASIETADVVCLLIDATQKFGHGDEFALEAIKNVRKPVFLLLNKTDIVRKENLLLLIDRYRALREFKEFIPISAFRGTNVDVLEKLLIDNLPPAEKLYGDDDVSDQSERFLLAEIIREKILARVEAELPWATAVYIDQIDRNRRMGNRAPGGEDEDVFSEEDTELAAGDQPSESQLDNLSGQEPGPIRDTGREIAVPGVSAEPNMRRREEKPKPTREERRARPLVYIKASIFVERPNHRKIIVGRQGKNIKEIGIEARREIEDILESKVYLELQVKVRPQWRDSADVLDLIEGQKET